MTISSPARLRLTIGPVPSLALSLDNRSEIHTVFLSQFLKVEPSFLLRHLEGVPDEPVRFGTGRKWEFLAIRRLSSSEVCYKDKTKGREDERYC
jgi:hypothetical protein